MANYDLPPSSANNAGQDDDSAIGDMSNRSSFTSVSPSIVAFPTDNGRTYHNYGLVQYLLPNDEQEQIRLNLQHALWKRILNGRLLCAPVHQSTWKIFDIATGTGSWAIDIANDFPSAKVIGVDVSPIQPVWHPPNVDFEIDDIEQDWRFSQAFDYIHGRDLVTCFQDFPGLIRKAFNALKPDGYLEFQEMPLLFCYDKQSLPGVQLDKWVELLFTGSKNLGQDWRKPDKCEQLMKDAGFVGIDAKKYKCPINQWGTGKQWRKNGAILAQIFSDGLLPISMQVFMRGLGWTYEQVVEFLEGVKRDLQDPNIRIYANFQVVYGQKP